MSPEAANAADKVKEVGMLGAYEVAPVVTGLIGATKGAVDAGKNGLNWQNGLEIGLNLLPGAIKGGKALLRNPNIVGKADALARQINDMTKEVKLTPTVDTNVGEIIPEHNAFFEKPSELPAAEPKPVQLHVVGQPEKVVDTEHPNLVKAIQDKFAKDYGDAVNWFEEPVKRRINANYQVKILGTKPLNEDTKAISKIMDGVIFEKYTGQDLAPYGKASTAALNKQTNLYIPESQYLIDRRIGGFAEPDTGNKFVELGITHKWPSKSMFRSVETHEGISHPTDKAVASLRKDGKEVSQLYTELSKPAGVAEEAKTLGLMQTKNSAQWTEARATRWEITQKMLAQEAEKRGTDIATLVKEDPRIVQKLADKLGPDELNELFNTVGTQYGMDYSTYLHLMPTRKAQAVYAGK